MKKKPMISLQTTMNFSQTLYRALEYHLPEKAEIIDPTPGEKYSWQYYLRETRRRSFFSLVEFNIHFIEDNITHFQNTAAHVKEHGCVDAVFFDPPYIFGNIGQGCAWGDVRREDYGGYHYTFEDIRGLINCANTKLPLFLKENGLLFLKYTDVFSLQDRKFFLCSFHWGKELSNFEAVDHYIIPHHHVSPTAWQVKDRPCGIVNYTYLTVFKKKRRPVCAVSLPGKEDEIEN